MSVAFIPTLLFPMAVKPHGRSIFCVLIILLYRHFYRQKMSAFVGAGNVEGKGTASDLTTSHSQAFRGVGMAEEIPALPYALHIHPRSRAQRGRTLFPQLVDGSPEAQRVQEHTQTDCRHR